MPGRRRRSKPPIVALVTVIVVVVLAAIVGGVVLATRDDGDGSEAADTADGLTVAQRTEALLTADDVGGDFAVVPDGRTNAGGPQLDGDEACGAVLGGLEEDGINPFGDVYGSDGTVSRELDAAEAGSAIIHVVGPPVGLVSAFRRLAADCSEVAFDLDDEYGGTVSIAVGTGPDLGDESIVLDVTFVITGGPTITGVYRAWSRDGNDVFIGYLSGFDLTAGAPVPLDRAQVDDLATLADQKLAFVIAGA